MKTPLYILGAGNVGAYLCYNIHDFNNYEIIGLFDDAIEKQRKKYYGYPVLGSIDNFKEYIGTEKVALAICIHSPKVKRSIFEDVQNSNVNFPNFISPYAWISESVTLGKGIIIYPGVTINYESKIGDFVNMNMNCAIGHNSTIEKFASLAPGVNLGGFTCLGQAVDMGIGSATIQNVKIGDHAIVGGQSMVLKDVEANLKVVGVPAYEV